LLAFHGKTRIETSLFWQGRGLEGSRTFFLSSVLLLLLL